jgi:hypothetical protein
MSPAAMRSSARTRSFLFVVAFAVLTPALVAQSECPEEEKDGLLQEAIEHVFCHEFSRVKVSGYLYNGFTFNPSSPKDRQNFGRLFDDRANAYRLNQLMVTVEQAVDHDECFDWGFKTQFGIGSDTRFTHTTGTLEDVTLTSVQPGVNELTATIHWKAGIDWDLKVGQFPSLCGLESIDPTGNVLYSHTYIFNFGVPFEHTGAMLFAQVHPSLQLMLGIDRGVNTGLDDNNDELALHAAVIGKLFDDALSFTLATHYGAENPDSYGPLFGIDPDGDKRFIIDLAATWQVNKCWKLMGDFNYGHEEAALGVGGTSPEWYGAAAYVVYSATKQVDFVLRGEWFRDNDGFAVTQFAENDDLLDIQNGILTGLDPRTVGGGPTSYYALTFGVNYRPCDSLLLQSEIRYDYAGSTTPFDDSTSDDQLTLAVAALFQF